MNGKKKTLWTYFKVLLRSCGSLMVGYLLTLTLLLLPSESLLHKLRRDWENKNTNLRSLCLSVSPGGQSVVLEVPFWLQLLHALMRDVWEERGSGSCSYWSALFTVAETFSTGLQMQLIALKTLSSTHLWDRLSSMTLVISCGCSWFLCFGLFLFFRMIISLL